MEYKTSLSDDHPNWVDVDIEEVCRICLQSENDLVLIFDELNSYNKISLAEMIRECSNCRVERHDDYPHQICLKCIETLKIAYNFRLKCKQSHKFAKLVLNNGYEPKFAIIDNDNLPPLDKFTQTEALTFFPCEKCDEKFISYEKLRTHRYYNHKGTSHECRVCKKSFRRIGYLKNHIAFYHPELGFENNIECSICSKKFGRPQHLRRHQINIHNQEFDTSLSSKKTEVSKKNQLNDDTIKKYICELCSTECETEDELKKHSCMEDFEIYLKSEETKIPKNNIENDVETDVFDLHIDDHQTDEDDLKPLSILKEVYEFEKTKNLNDTNIKKIKNMNVEKGKHKQLQTDYRCQTCQKKFLRPYHLRRHESSHLKIKSFNCIHCNKTYSRSDYLANHMTKFHSEKQLFKCEKCSNSFAEKENLLRHQNENKLCSIRSQSEDDLIKNSSNEIIEKSSTCKEKIYDNQDNDFENDVLDLPISDNHTDDENLTPLSKSEKVYESVKKDDLNDTNKVIIENKKVKNGRRTQIETEHRCKICQKMFLRAYHLRRHERSHLNERPFNCIHCKKCYSQSYILDKHLTKFHSEKQPFKCKKCNNGFPKMENLRRHLNQNQCNSEQEKNVKQKPKVKNPKLYKCEICQKGFTTERSHGVHVSNHSSKTFPCKFCKMVHKTKAESVEHSKTHDKEKPFLCSKCGHRFVRNDNLIIHMRRHNGEKPYKCKFCNKGFPRYADLNVHERYHTDERNFVCKICGKGFQRGHQLVIHTRVHTGERPYKCSECPKSFAQRNDLKTHIRRHTGERFYCEICNEGFIQGYLLRQHKKTAHGIDQPSQIHRLEKIAPDPTENI